MSAIFDSHAHLVSADHARYPPTPLKGTLDRELVPFTAEDLLRQMDQVGVERAVVVQRAHVYGFNNAYVADAAAQFPDRLVSVGMIDSLDTNATELVRQWVQVRGMVGIRMTEAIRGSDTGWVSGPIAQEIWSVATELGASVCFHFMPWNREQCLNALLDMCTRYPDTMVVVDHFSNLAGEKGDPHFGVDVLLERLSKFPNVVQKFTTINVSKLAAQGLACAPVVKRMVQTYGSDRVMWGSDVAQSSGSYAQMVEFAQEATRLLSEEERNRVLYGTAHSIYARDSWR